MCSLTELDELELAVKGLKRDLAERLRTIANELLLVDELLEPDNTPAIPTTTIGGKPALLRTTDDLQEASTLALNAAGKLAKIALELERDY